MVGGPGADFLWGQAGRDHLYVDIFDVWVGGLPEDVIIGGPTQTAGSPIGTTTSALDKLGLSLTDGAVERMAAALAEIQNGIVSSSSVGMILDIRTGTGTLWLSFLLPSEIIIISDMNFEGAIAAIVRGGLRGELAGGQISFIGSVPLIGIGLYLEVQWGTILLLLAKFADSAPPFDPRLSHSP